MADRKVGASLEPSQTCKRVIALVIAITYHSDNDAVKLANSLAQCADADQMCLLIVDNASATSENGQRLDFVQRLTETFPHSLYCRCPENLGYYGGAAYGLKWYLSNHHLADWVIVSNVDIEVTDTFVHDLQKIAPGSGAIIAPRILNPTTGFDTNPYLVVKPPLARLLFLSQIYRSQVLTNLYILAAQVKRSLATRRNAPPSLQINPRHIYAPHGAFVIFPAEYFAAGGTLDFPGFLFGEEFFVAESAIQAGLEVLYIPSIVVIHREHTSTGHVRSKRMIRYMKESAELILQNYYNKDS